MRARRSISHFRDGTSDGDGRKIRNPSATVSVSLHRTQSGRRADAIGLDEAWLMLRHPLFQEKIRAWLKTLRKTHCAVVFATQSISDVGTSALRDVLYESCPTKILLANPEVNGNEE